MTLPATALPRRVLFVHQSADLYGSDRVLLQCVSALEQAGGRAVVALPGPGPLADALAARRVETHLLGPDALLRLDRRSLSPTGLARLVASLPAAWRQLDRCAAGGAIDLVVSNTLAVLGGAVWARQQGLPHVWHVHEMVERPRAAASAFALLLRVLADAVICNSQATRAFYVERQPRLAPRMHVIWNGVDATQSASCGQASAASSPLYDQFRPNGERLAIGLIGRINRMKGHALLLEAAERLDGAGCRDFSIVFIGSAPPGQESQLADLGARIAASPLRERVRIFGFMADTDAAYAALDVVCVPSCEAEAFGLVAVEAMAAQRAVVAARIGGLPEIVRDGQTGLLHAPRDAADLAKQLGTVLNDDAHRFALASAGRRRFESDFTVHAMTQRVLAVLAAAHAGRKAVAAAHGLNPS